MKLQVVDNAKQHFVLPADEPIRAEIMVVGGNVAVHVYKGTEPDRTQEPVGGYFGDMGYKNCSWEVGS